MEECRLNLVVFMREYPVGMAGTKRIQNFLDYLILQNISIQVISFRSQTRQPSVKGEYNTIPYLNISPGLEFKLSQLHKIIAYYFIGFKAIVHLRKKGFVNITYNSGGLNIENLFFILWSKILRYRLILAIEEDYGFFNDEIKLISKFKCWTIRKLDFLNCRLADAIVVISFYLQKKYIKLKAKKVLLIPVTAKLNFNKDKNSFNDPLQVIYAGSFADKDGVNDIIEGFLAFNRVHENARLILTGKSSQKSVYENKYRSNGNIVFKGFLEDKEFYSLLRSADVLCMCRTESGFANAGFPFKLGEYLATGNPVICTRVSDIETYLDEQDAFLIDPGNPGQICESLNSILADQVVARKIGLNGLEKCRRFFSPEVNGRLLLELMVMVSNK